MEVNKILFSTHSHTRAKKRKTGGGEKLFFCDGEPAGRHISSHRPG